MLNEQAPSKVHHREDGWLFVHSIFNTIQGEGPFAGWPATFLRLYGCNLQCPWCDTEYTSKREDCHPMHLAREIMSHHTIRAMRLPLVVITGGEPFRQNLKPLLDFLLGEDFMVQIETNGVLDPGSDFQWDHENLVVVCSPKTGKIHPNVEGRVDAYKYVLSYDGVADDGLPVAALGHPLGKYPHVARPPEDWEGPIYLNPMDAEDSRINRFNLDAVTQSVLNHGRYVMGVQMHKMVNLP